LVCLGFGGPSRSEPPIHFNRDVLPILSDNCFQCHGPDERARKAKLRLDTSEGVKRVVVPGKPMDSELVRRILSDSAEERMPPPKTKHALSAAQKDMLRRWVEQGIPWSKHWAFEPPIRLAAPAVQNTAWPRNALDHFVLAELERQALPPSPEAAKETLIRRVTLDLTGLPPTVSEVDAFCADTSPDAYEKVVDRLLASPRYGERMALDWLDAARYADTNGYQNDFGRSMWLWRDWVIGAYNRNLSFDRFVVEQLAGDLLPGVATEQKIASGFNRNNRTVTEAGSIDEEWRVENVVDRVETTATAFLGLTLGCARCHDHKFDPISQREFYQFYAFFNSMSEPGVYVEKRGNAPPVLSFPTAENHKTLRELDAKIAAAEKKLHNDKTLPADKRKPLEQQLTQLRQEQTDYQQRIVSVMVTEELPQPRQTFVLQRGRYELPDKKQRVLPDVPACFAPLPKDTRRRLRNEIGTACSFLVPPSAVCSISSLILHPAPLFPNRLDLARWLVSPENPLTARVAVNRYWQHYFGVGLVKSTENFGVQSEPPTHPALLDWLATEFVRTGWDVKALQRLIVTSATYRQASDASPALLQRDPENRWLARGPRLRLPAEIIRDNALAIAGLLVEQVGGPSIKSYQPAGLWEEMAGFVGKELYVQDHGNNLYRRSLYLYRKRTVPQPLLATFDAPSGEICQVKRGRTNTPLQALELLNDVTYVEAARHLAQLMLCQPGTGAGERLAFAFRRATARMPTSFELQILRRGLERHQQQYRNDPVAARRLLGHGEAPVDARLDPIELAAYTATAAVILNLDETVTKE
jgi:hypothetical protein